MPDWKFCLRIPIRVRFSVDRVINYVISGAIAVVGINSMTDGPLNGAGDAIIYLLVLLIMWGYGYNTGKQFHEREAD